MPRLRQLLLLFVLLWLAGPATLLAQTETPAAANKRLFDRTVDELNFRTMETVYDRSFTRRKFPVTLRTAKARREFDDFADRSDLKTLFHNYNGVSERYKGRFGKGRTDLVEFEKQLNSILIDRNFEFFIRVLPRDERVALIRALQRVIKQGTAQFNASEDPEPAALAADGAAVPPADVDAEAPLASPIEDPAPEPETVAPTTASRTGALTSNAAPEAGVPSRYGLLDYLSFLMAAAALGLTLRLTLVTVPELQRRLDGAYEPQADDDLEEDAPEAAFSPVKRRAGLPEDRYEDGDDS
ncbi:hypothetical protein HER32_18300 [Hymenobacter sp. BT18]|uniref:hypothetical protein n=1 Tax=Hymenobacter sp. BT18 TaxID=2835648 RepID=UPI00143E236D|nr:hypothetical protein [Hymenobacter sp. BT18]QIX63019.1 hypothetical protein HER32_18300 [Hymenobacter sp. BT18]